MKFNSFLILILIEVLVVWRVHCRSSVLWNFDQRPICFPSDDQWKLINWYFERVGYLEVTTIVQPNRGTEKSNYVGNFIIHRLYEFLGIDFRVFSVDQDYVDYKAPTHDTYAWHAKRYQSKNEVNSSTHKHVSPWIEDTESTKNNRISGTRRMREDEPEVGGLVLVKNLQLIDSYLDGPNRHPFAKKRGNYVILVFHEVDRSSWDQWASDIMAKLWEDHGILNAIILSSCKQDNVGYYDPYVNTRDLGLSLNHDQWGFFRCVPLALFDFKDDWILRKEWSLNGYPLTVSTFRRYPTMVPADLIPKFFLQTQYARAINSSNGFGGFDGFILANMAEIIQFKVQIAYPIKGTYLGTLREVLNERADISFNSRFLIDYNTDEIEFLTPLSGDKVCVIAPAAQRIPQWFAIFRCFSYHVWIAFAVSTFFSGGVWFLLKQLHPMEVAKLRRQNKRRRQTQQKSTMISRRIFFRIRSTMADIWKIMLGASAALPQRTTERIFIGACLVTNVIILGSYEGSLYTSFSTTSYYKEIDTLEDLDASGFTIATSAATLQNLFGNDTNDSGLFGSLKKKYYIYDVDAMPRAAYDRDMCCVERFSDVEIIIRTKYRNTDGSSMLHVVKECPQTYFLTYIVRKGWPLLPRFNTIIRRLSEGGFLQLWYDQVENAFVMHSLYSQPIQPSKLGKQAFSLTDMQTAFYILIIGYLIALTVFVAEKCIWPPKRPVQLPYLP